MRALFVALVFTLLIVIIDPYKNIRHNQINVYKFKKEYAEKVIEVIEPEDEHESLDWPEYLEQKYGEKYGEKDGE